jgi:hypothetical protein
MASANTIRIALMKLLSEGKPNIPTKTYTKGRNTDLDGEGPGPEPYDSLTEEGAQGFADPRLLGKELADEEWDELLLGPTLSKAEKTQLKAKKQFGEKKPIVKRLADKQKLYEATTDQQSYKSAEDPAGEKMTLDIILESEIDESLASKANEAGRVSNQNKSVQKWRDKSQLENLGRSSDEQKILDKSNEVIFNVNKAAEKNPALSGGQNKFSNSPTTVFNREGPTKIRARIGEVAKRFGQKEDLNADIQDMYSRLDELFPGFKKSTPDSDEFFELDVKGKKIPGAKLQGGKDASMASKLNDTKKELRTLAQRAREEDDPKILMVLKRKLDEIDTQYFRTTSTQETRQLGNTINPESNVQSLQGIDKDTGENLLDFVAPNRTDAGVEFNGSNLSDELGPKSPPLIEQLRRNKSNFDPAGRQAPPVSGTLSTQDTLINILKDIQQNKLGPIGQ